MYPEVDLKGPLSALRKRCNLLDIYVCLCSYTGVYHWLYLPFNSTDSLFVRENLWSAKK